MIETYKILTGKYDEVAVPNLNMATTLTTRGNDLRLQNNCTRYDLHIFTNRVVNTWNCLLNLLICLRNDWINNV